MASPELAGSDTVVLDMDGTLVDSVYQHVSAWDAALAEVGIAVPRWSLHRAIGMGGDRLVAAVCGDEVERTHGDGLRESHGRRYAESSDEVRPLPGAEDLVRELHGRGLSVVLASSGRREQTEAAIALLGLEDLDLPSATSSDVESSKPASDLVEAAVGLAGGRRAVMVGDSTWDVEAAERSGVPALGLRCGGFGEGELREAGAVAVFDDPRDLLANLDRLGLGR